MNSTTDGIEFSTNSAPVSIVTTNPRSGTNHGRVNGGAGFWRQIIFTSNQTTVGYIGIAILIHASVNANTQLVRWSTTGNVSVGNITLKTDDTLVLLKSDGTQIGSPSSALTHDQWYYVELKNDASTSPGTLEARLNGSVFASGSNSNQGSWARALIGNVTGTQTTNDIYFDDWKINDSSGSNQTGYPGTGKVIIIRPDSAGDSNAWLQTAGGAGSSTNWGLVDETPPNDATDFVNSGTLNNEDLYNMSASGIQSYDTVNVVQIGARFRNDTADATTAFKTEVIKTSGGTVSQGSAIIPNLTTWKSYQTAATDVYVHTLYNDPDGSAWTNTTLDSMQAGVKLTASNVNKVQVTALWVYIDYTPGTPPSSTPNKAVVIRQAINRSNTY
ncbi:MAG TPA: hypothetical protein VJ464_13390 [Blastocatellia bacterium]|nr:hypothetical protein [Blastocatellia bacterium]